MKYKTGVYRSYYWLEFHFDTDLNLAILVQKKPELFLDKYIAIAYNDSGIFAPSQEEIESGWFLKNEIAYSPKITKQQLSFPLCDHFDQWYIFNQQKEIHKVKSFVNYGGFSIDPNWDGEKELQMEFWKHIIELEPDSFVQDGDRLIYISKEHSEIETIISLTNA